MNKIIKLRVKREISSSNEIKVLQLKGKLIAKGYTEIIHIADENEDFYLNSFSTSSEKTSEINDFILKYISHHSLTDMISVI